MVADLQKLEASPGALASRRSDAMSDDFVTREMARGERVRRATRYTQSLASCALQVAGIGVPLGVGWAVAVGTILGGVAVAAGAMVTTATLMLLETSNRIAVTDRALVVQYSFLLGRYELDRIENPRVEVLGPAQWFRYDVAVLDPRYLLRKGPGLRFRYRKSERRTVEVFIGVADAHEYLALIQSAGVT